MQQLRTRAAVIGHRCLRLYPDGNHQSQHDRHDQQPERIGPSLGKTYPTVHFITPQSIFRNPSCLMPQIETAYRFTAAAIAIGDRSALRPEAPAADTVFNSLLALVLDRARGLQCLGHFRVPGQGGPGQRRPARAVFKVGVCPRDQQYVDQLLVS